MAAHRINQLQIIFNRPIRLNLLVIILLLTISTLTAASEGGAESNRVVSISGKKKIIPATIIRFSEYEQGTGIYPVTLTVTEDFLRIDDNIISSGGSHGFVLFKRKEKVIYSVNPQEQQIVKIQYRPVTIEPPMELKLRTEKMTMKQQVPSVSGKRTEHHQFFVNGKLCYDLFSVPGLLPDAVTAMKNFNQVLAGQQAESLRYIPVDVYEVCDLVKNTFYPQRYLEKGFPILEQEIEHTMKKNGTLQKLKYSRTLINYIKQDVSAKRFVLPEYQVLKLN